MKLILYFSGKYSEELRSKERIVAEFKERGIKLLVFDISQNYELYGNTFTFENSFMTDFCESESLETQCLPLLRIGKQVLKGEKQIQDNMDSITEVLGV